ncbi:hypothetical protein FE257_012747 [Aspergillus nanangensis]|uniref:Chromatin assembly factor 1 subunit A n=1 Tax=Aspergillus nanangensis TaxID=2582783 RepID=A0AAD4GQM3_ASPNN|nr:hypothetical protein FE257_012747 [Aspergillus nanangensis]
MQINPGNKSGSQNTDGDATMADTAKGSTLGESALNTIPTSNATTDPSTNQSCVSAAPGTPSAKKRKLSPASQEAKHKEKEAKEKQKMDDKLKKDEEKAKKEEEKAKKEEERRLKEEEKKKRDVERDEERKKREEKRKAREEEKAAKEDERRKKEAAKEEERRKKEEERLKKERAQPKLNAFFVKPKVPSQPSTSNSIVSPKKPAGDEYSNQPPTKTVSDYSRAFPEFFLQSHTEVAPPHRFGRDADALQHMRQKLDSDLKSADGLQEPPVFRPSEIFKMMPYTRRRGKLPASVKQILLQMQSLGDEASSSEATQRQRDLLTKLRMKSLKFGEDVRPSYQGTYTKSLPVSSAHKMMRNPYHRGLPETNYDYDSEAEWEEPEEGEDLDSEEEDDMSEEGDDDMDGFLDDEDDQLAGKKGAVAGDQEPVSTGLRWQENGVDPELKMYKIETISDSVTFPIDPFSTVYWHKPKPAEPVQAGTIGKGTLHAFVGNQPGASTQDGNAPTTLTSGKAKRSFPPEQLDDFKQVVTGSDLTKTGLIEVLKKRFPKVSKDVLKDTLNSVATRVGQKEADKKWVCN